MKEFIVNDRKLATVECNIPVRECPVFQRLFDVDSKEMPLFATTIDHDAGIRMETVPDRVRELKTKVMTMCMECNCSNGR